MASFRKLFSSVAALSMALAVTAQDVPLRLMPLGASITFGQGSSDGNGYRQVLLDSLNNAGYEVDYVGSQQGGSMADPDNEGYPGLRIDQVHEIAIENVPDYLPNVYAINLGTNDAAQDHIVDDAGARMGDLLNYLWTATPDATVILSTLIINLTDETEARAVRINTQFSELANRLRDEGRRIVLVDMHGADGPTSDDMADATHPNDVGFEKMAALWFQGIEEASAAGFIQPA